MFVFQEQTVNSSSLMQKIYLSLFLLCIQFALHAQKYNVKGMLIDSSGQPLVAATVMIMDADSVLIDYSLTDHQGEFEFKAIRESQAIFKATYLGYIPLTIPVNDPKKPVADLGKIIMSEMDVRLMEVVIKEAKAPLRLKGDTVEYDISQFRVPEGATLEELLKRLPGLEVSQEGSIQSDGKDVTKLTVDGKTFFSEDPKFAIKNLPAEGVSKVQVFDKKDEEALQTGVQSNTNEKTMNVELKDEFKKGGFGKATVGGGSESTGELKGNYNKFDKVNQLSLVAVANNTGRNGLSWDDYQDFMGSNSWEDNSDYVYGFGNRGFRSFGGSSESNLESKVRNSFFSGNSGGFPKNLIGGVNYNLDQKKNKFSGRYFFMNTGNVRETSSTTRTFLTGFNQDNLRFNTEDRGNLNHRAETKYQIDIDSLLTFVITADGALANARNENQGLSAVYKNEDDLTSSSNFRNSSDLSGRLWNTSFLMRKRFKKPGRSIGVNASYLKTDINETQQRFSDNFFNYIDAQPDSIFRIRQYNNDTLDKHVIQANALYSEPLSSRFFLKLFYNLSVRSEEGTRITQDEDVDMGFLTRNDLLSRLYDNQITSQRTGTSIRYSHKNQNITIGGAWQQFDLNGSYRSPDPNLFSGVVKNKFDLWLPYVEYSGNLNRNSWISADYSVNASEPSIEQLLPVVDFSNPLFITEGNPDLVPSLTHDIGSWANYSWPANGVRMYGGIRYSFFEDQIITDQQVDENLVTRSKPVNYDGGTQFWTNLGVSFPIVRNKLKMSTNMNYSLNESFAFVNTILNKTNTVRWSPHMSIDFTPTDKTAVYLNANAGFATTEYNINTTQNQTLINQNYNLDVTQNLTKGWFVKSTLRYTFLKNERFGIDQNIPILNFSVYKQLLKGNKGEIRLSLYDALNRNIQISQNTSVSRVFRSETPSLARYFMLSFSYNIRGMKSTVGRDQNW